MPAESFGRVIRVLVLLDKGQPMTRAAHQALREHLQQRAPDREIYLTDTDYAWSTHRGSFVAYLSAVVADYDVFIRPVAPGAAPVVLQGSNQIIQRALAAGKRVRIWDGTALRPVTGTEYAKGMSGYLLSVA